MGNRTHFYWQHHARPHGDGVLSLFDDGAAPAEETVSARAGPEPRRDGHDLHPRALGVPPRCACRRRGERAAPERRRDVGRLRRRTQFLEIFGPGRDPGGRAPSDRRHFLSCFRRRFRDGTDGQAGRGRRSRGQREPHCLRQLERGNRGRGVAGLWRRQVECLIRRGNGRLGRLRDGCDREQRRALLPGRGVGQCGARSVGQTWSRRASCTLSALGGFPLGKTNAVRQPLWRPSDAFIQRAKREREWPKWSARLGVG